MPKSHTYLQTMTQEPAKLQVDPYETAWQVAHTRYPLSVVKCISKRKGIIPQGEPNKTKWKKNKGLLIYNVRILALTMNLATCKAKRIVRQ